jgi:hypothetical protein
LTHSSLGAQTLPQLPQWFASVWTSTQSPPQACSVPEHIVVQLPLLHTCESLHA